MKAQERKCIAMTRKKGCYNPEAQSVGTILPHALLSMQAIFHSCRATFFDTRLPTRSTDAIFQRVETTGHFYVASRSPDGCGALQEQDSRQPEGQQPEAHLLPCRLMHQTNQLNTQLLEDVSELPNLNSLGSTHNCTPIRELHQV